VDQFVQQLVNGITLGAVYGLIALGYSMVYGVLKLLNFAHGDVFMIGAFIGYFVLVGLGGPGSLVVPVPLVLLAMLFAAGLGCGVLGVIIERYAYRPLRSAPRIAPLITALGVSLFLQNSMLLLFGADVRNYDTSQFLSFGTGVHVGPLDISLVRILVIVLALVLMAALTRMIGRTTFGKAMRAVAYDREAAQMMGIDVDATIARTFFVGSVLAGSAGVMVGLVFFQAWHLMGFLAGLKGFTAAVIGGIGSMAGAMLGGLLIGLAEAFSAGYISSTWQNLIVFGVLIATMVVRPYGLLGRRDLMKV
jgi:branched-chain amino acid transport system permease protein